MYVRNGSLNGIRPLYGRRPSAIVSHACRYEYADAAIANPKSEPPMPSALCPLPSALCPLHRYLYSS